MKTSAARISPALFAALFLAFFSFSACADKQPETLKTGAAQSSDSLQRADSQTAATTFAIDLAESQILWEGSEGLAVIKESHNGSLALLEGSLTARGGAIVGGDFTVDMTSLRNADIKSEKMRAKLEKHLKGEDFFDVERFPTAHFEITSVSALPAKDSVLLTGNLTMKDVAKSVSFPASVSLDSALLRASAAFFINRKDWAIHYRTEESLGDELIRPEIGLRVSIIAKSAQ
jgi:polyisoprenoid-binding protein YceI